MPNRNYVNGRAFEYKTKKKLEQMGYTVFRTAGSHSKVDLIAYDIEHRVVWFIQCKAGHLSEKERERIYSELDVFKSLDVATGVLVEERDP
jgi:Holliday junction resolvase